MKILNGRIEYTYQDKKHRMLFPVAGEISGPGLTIISEILDLPLGKEIKVRLVPESQIVLNSCSLETEGGFKKTDRFFLNGYQSWTESREYRYDEIIPGLSKTLFPLYSDFHVHNFGDYHFHKYRMKSGFYHSHTYTYIRNCPGCLEFIGSLSENQGFTIFQFETGKDRLEIRKDCAGLAVQSAYEIFRLFTIKGDDKAVFENYFARMGINKPKAPIATGWTSWYYYYEKVTEKDILENLEEARKNHVPLDFFQIDDGFEPAVGDWLAPCDKFPHGMKYLADEIRKAGYKPGIWLAPFICDNRSSILKEHPDWIIKNEKGEFYIAGKNAAWDGYFYGLDITHPGVREYITKVFRTAIDDWGFDLLKIDFLYGGCLKSLPDKTRGEIMAEGIDFLRKLAGDKILLGCGVPLGSVFGKTEYCRIGPDVHLDWENKDPAIIHYRERVSTIHTLLNTIFRRQLSGLAFQNDPDVLILRSTKTTLTKIQKYTVFMVNMLFGGIGFTSDRFSEYTEAEWRLYLSLFPIRETKILSVDEIPGYRWKLRPSPLQAVVGVKPYENAYLVSFTIGNSEYRTAVNLGRKKIRFSLEKGLYYDAQTKEFVQIAGPITLEPFETRCYLKVRQSDFSVAASTAPLIPASDVLELTEENGNIHLKSFRMTNRPGSVLIRMPNNSQGCLVNGIHYPAKEILPDLNIVEVPV